MSRFPPPVGEGLRVGGSAVQHARRLRKNLSQPERTLWTHLKQYKKQGAHFRRQVALGQLFADFACHSLKLVIEVDGHLHGTSEALDYNAARTNFIAGEGYKVLRFTNSDISTNLGGVLSVIQLEVDQRLNLLLPPTPAPPHQGEGSAAPENS